MRPVCCLFTTLFLLLLSVPASAQAVTFSDLDKSPMDATHYPFRSRYLNYLPEDDDARVRRIKVLYSRPQKKDREIFGGIIPWGSDWRLGANEATEVTFYRDVDINNTFVPAGTYTMFAQVYPDQWIVRISKERFIGGSQNRDTSKDIVVASVPTSYVADAREYFTIGFQRVDDDRVNMLFEWDHTRATLPVSFNAVMLEEPDVSPMDLVQYPDRSRLRNFVKEEELAENEPRVRVVYSRPQAKGRTIFGGMLEYGSTWRLGANETTLITFFEEVTIDGKTIKPGDYGLFAEVAADSWTFILHRNVQSWGTPNHDPADNVLTLTAKTERTPETLEALSMTFVEKSPQQIELVVGWGDTMARLPISLE